MRAVYVLLGLNSNHMVHRPVNGGTHGVLICVIPVLPLAYSNKTSGVCINVTQKCVRITTVAVEKQ
jgi:hypothetical protein